MADQSGSSGGGGGGSVGSSAPPAPLSLFPLPPASSGGAALKDGLITAFLKARFADRGSADSRVLTSVPECRLARLLQGVACLDANDAFHLIGATHLEMALSKLLQGEDFTSPPNWASRFLLFGAGGAPLRFLPLPDHAVAEWRVPGFTTPQRSPASFEEMLEQLGFTVCMPGPHMFCPAPPAGSTEGAVLDASREALRGFLIARVRALAREVVAAEAAPSALPRHAATDALAVAEVYDATHRTGKPRAMEFASVNPAWPPAARLLYVLGWRAQQPPSAPPILPLPHISAWPIPTRFVEGASDGCLFAADPVFRRAALEELRAATVLAARGGEAAVPIPLVQENDYLVALDVIENAGGAERMFSYKFPKPEFFETGGATSITLPGTPRLLQSHAGCVYLFAGSSSFVAFFCN